MNWTSQWVELSNLNAFQTSFVNQINKLILKILLERTPARADIRIFSAWHWSPREMKIHPIYFLMCHWSYFELIIYGFLTSLFLIKMS